MELTLEQKKALALASARLKVAQKAGQVETAPQEQPVTMKDRLLAATSGGYRGIAGLAGLPVDTAQNVINLGIAGVGTLAGMAGRPDLMPEPISGSVGSSEWIAKHMEKAGAVTETPRPDDATSRMLNTAGMIAFASMVPGVGLKNTLTAAAGGAIAGEVGGPGWVGLGAISPAALAEGSRLALGARSAIASRVKPRVEAFKAAGAEPSLGEATGNSFFQGIENLVAKFPGGAGRMSRFSEKFQRDIGSQTKTGVSAEDAGRTIESGVTGRGGFIERTSETWKKMDANLARKMASSPSGGNVAPANTMAALDDLTRPVKGAERSTGGLANDTLVKLRDNFARDIIDNWANGGVVPYEALRRIRSDIGAKLDQALVSDIPTGQLNQVYKALTSDMEAAAKAAGAGKDFARQNKFYAARMDRVEGVLNKVIGKMKQPEDIFKAIDPKDPNAAGKLTATLRSLRPAERQIGAKTVVNRLGRAKPGKQNEVGDIFSTETFLTNWNNISPRAKAQLFTDPQMVKDLDAIAKASWTVRSGAGFYNNSSGTAGSLAA